MKFKRKTFLLAPLVTAAVLFAAGSPASAATTYGTLDNFDVINDTGGECHGFEIELEGLKPADIVYTFETPYIRYDKPTIIETGTGVIVRYASAYNGAWVASTPVPAVTPDPATLGHMCWGMPDINNNPDPTQPYWTSGCEHFGISLNASPTKTTYRWLVENPGQPGTLMHFGTNVPLPAPAWNVTPPAAPGAQPAVVAVVQAPPVAPNALPGQWGEPIWVKIFKTEIPSGLVAEDLNQLVLDAAGVDIVPNEPVETEIEWMLLQSPPDGVVGANEQSENGGEVAAGTESVSRRYEYYKYLGPVNPEDGEARCDNPDNCPGAVGDFIGAQNAAVNLAGIFNPPPQADNQPPVALCKDVLVAAAPGLCSAAASVDNGSFDPEGGALVMSQSPAGPFGVGANFVTLTVTDDKGAWASCVATVTVADNQAPVVSVPASAVLEGTGPGGAAVSFSTSALDNCSVASTSCAPASGSIFPLGSTAVACSATDVSGNTGSASFTVTVRDTTPPAVTAPANITVAATSAAGAAVTYPACSVKDIVDSAPAVAYSKASGTTFPVGTTPVTCTATDASGNTGTASFNVTVVIGQPKITGSIAATGWDASGLFYADLTLTNTGNGIAKGLVLSKVTPKVLAGRGKVSYSSPKLPQSVGDLNTGASQTIRLFFKVPSTVSQFSITESGTIVDVTGTSYSYSTVQTVTP